MSCCTVLPHCLEEASLLRRSESCFRIFACGGVMKAPNFCFWWCHLKILNPVLIDWEEWISLYSPVVRDLIVAILLLTF